MDKASKALRRSSVRLMALNTGHGDLNMIISDLGEVRSTSKAFLASQSTAWQDMVKWASRERNSALQEVFQHFYELNGLWSEIQLEFIGSLKKFKHQFEVILEGEQHIVKCQNHLSSCEQREVKLRKDLKKAIAKGSEEGRQYEERLISVKALVQAAQTDVNDKINNQEAVKFIMAKESLIDLSESYLELAEKAVFIFDACRNIAKGLPDIVDKGIQEVKYTGSEAAKLSVLKAKEDVHCYKPSRQRQGAPPVVMPPPYTCNPMANTLVSYFPNVAGANEHRYYDVPDETQGDNPCEPHGDPQYENQYHPQYDAQCAHHPQYDPQYAHQPQYDPLCAPQPQYDAQCAPQPQYDPQCAPQPQYDPQCAPQSEPANILLEPRSTALPTTVQLPPLTIQVPIPPHTCCNAEAAAVLRKIEKKQKKIGRI